MNNPFSSLFGSAPLDLGYKEGECWSYFTRPNEEESFVVIRKIETLEVGEVVHVSLFGLRIQNGAGMVIADRLSHLPILRSSLLASLKKRIQKATPEEDWCGGYRMWREAYDSDRGGVFKEPLSECVEVFDRAMKQAAATEQGE